MRKHLNDCIYDNKVILSHWDFLCNPSINVFKTKVTDDIEVSHKCKKCGHVEKGKLNKLYPFKCSNCNKNKRLSDNSKHIIEIIFWFIYSILLVTFVYLLGENIVSRITTYSNNHDAYLIVLMAFLLSEIVIMLKITNYSLTKSNDLKDRKNVFVRLINVIPNIDNFNIKYGKAIEERLYMLLSRNNPGIDTEKALSECIENKVNYVKYFKNNIKDGIEFNALIKKYNDKFYYSELYPLYAVAKLSYYKNSIDPIFIFISISISIVSLLYKIHFDIQNRISIENIVFDILSIVFVVLLIGFAFYSLKKSRLIKKINTKISFISAATIN